jgi:hypothetical protein
MVETLDHHSVRYIGGVDRGQHLNLEASRISTVEVIADRPMIIDVAFDLDIELDACRTSRLFISL